MAGKRSSQDADVGRLLLPDDVDGPFELDISGTRMFLGNAAIRLHSLAFEQFSQPAGGSVPDYRRQLALLSKGGDPFAGVGGALVPRMAVRPWKGLASSPSVTMLTESSRKPNFNASRISAAFWDGIRSKVASVSFV
jgi:hypothetical protein